MKTFSKAHRKAMSEAAKARWKDKHKRRKLLKVMRSSEHIKLVTKITKDSWDKNRDMRLAALQSEKCSKKHSDTAKKVFGTKEYKEYRSEYTRKGYKDGTRPVSSFGGESVKTKKAGKISCRGDELFVATLLDSSDIISKFGKETIRIPYKWHGKHKTYFPDFYAKTIDGVRCLIEVKSNLDKLSRFERKKLRVMQVYCKRKGWKFILIAFGVMDQSKGGN
jgi:hypothetical protein